MRRYEKFILQSCPISHCQLCVQKLLTVRGLGWRDQNLFNLNSKTNQNIWICFSFSFSRQSLKAKIKSSLLWRMPAGGSCMITLMTDTGSQSRRHAASSDSSLQQCTTVTRWAAASLNTNSLDSCPWKHSVPVNGDISKGINWYCNPLD